MNEQACQERFYQLIHPSHPNEWEIEDLLRRLAGLPIDRQEVLLSQVPVIWPVSHSLCLAFLEQGARRIAVPDHLLADWVRALLQRYERDGLRGARTLLDDGGAAYLASREKRSAVVLEQIAPWLSLFVAGLAGGAMELAAGRVAATDTVTLRLPPEIDYGADNEANTVLYKMIAALHVGFIRQGTFRLVPHADDLAVVGERFSTALPAGRQPTLPACFALFPEPQLAADLFFIGECRRALRWIDNRLPGLARQWRAVLPTLRQWPAAEPTPLGAAVSQLALAALHSPSGPESPEDSAGAAEAPCSALIERYLRVAGRGGAYRRPLILEVLGYHDFSGAAEQLEIRRALVREAFIRQLGRLVADHHQQGGEQSGGDSDQADAAQIMLVEAAEPEQATRRLVLHIDNERCQLPDELQELAAEILEDRGRIPAAYIAAAAGVAGGVASAGHQDDKDSNETFSGPAPGARLIDEWDFRRNGYRKNWCAVYEKELPLVQSNFVASTLQTYHGVLLRLRRQFEMMRVDESFVGRQREGDELDLDAVVDARADRRASTAASDRLFVRLQRNERDLASLFLVDLSNSTQGWVGTVIKEALVVLCEAMAAAGDRYGIYGFSGMRRSRCELFPIKRLHESYGDAVVRRIGSIAPREYTRLGPAIRRSAELLGESDARTRLLVTLTDGKPEDYDDYKGEYAIEDTRKALLEVRGSGIHAFGVTIDRQARDYLPRIFGSEHFLLIDQVQQLPLRMVDLYRHLTS